MFLEADYFVYCSVCNTTRLYANIDLIAATGGQVLFIITVSFISFYALARVNTL